MVIISFDGYGTSGNDFYQLPSGSVLQAELLKLPVLFDDDGKAGQEALVALAKVGDI